MSTRKLFKSLKQLSGGGYQTNEKQEEEKANKTIDDFMKESVRTLTALGVSLEQYKVLEDSIGRGTYGIVKLVEKDGVRYAMKQLIKEEILKVSCLLRSDMNSLQFGKMEQVFKEQEIMSKLHNDAFPKLFYTLQVSTISYI